MADAAVPLSNRAWPSPDLAAPAQVNRGTQRHSPRPPGASPLPCMGVKCSHFVWAQPGRTSTACDPDSRAVRGETLVLVGHKPPFLTAALAVRED
jgi:hypothetical protein